MPESFQDAVKKIIIKIIIYNGAYAADSAAGRRRVTFAQIAEQLTDLFGNTFARLAEELKDLFGSTCARQLAEQLNDLFGNTCDKSFPCGPVTRPDGGPSPRSAPLHSLMHNSVSVGCSNS
jgi:hypothetical protein